VIRALIGIGVAGWVGYSLMPDHARLATWHAESHPLAKLAQVLTPQWPSIDKPAARHMIASSKIVGERCYVHGQANGTSFTFSVDTGDPFHAEFSASHVRELGINPASLHYEELWPGTRYGKIATTTLRELRVGDVTWNNVQIRIYSDWRYTFGDDESPLLGLAALQSRGIHVEFDGDMCRLTAPSLVEARR